MMEIDVPTAFVGRTLRELDVRRRHGVQVLLVRRERAGTEREEVVPDGETRIRSADRLVLLGREDRIARFRRRPSSALRQAPERGD
ncbi:MAG: hypothetical protein GWM90_16385 [Gemmatimonadetes bacterium]|nr:hypothetical protein [Gemmatimonadota bacterium]NIQ53964.1 hypothetical protein [Gemmatimonadota bacterium]NIU74145.1 hypothetical protein [Gammaproteobacteria bacterium]NIX45620.1 hypothetical protein [Gemmatimonadota bacterium]NIY08412.1 hypothetical protein [Gemmatimonadota bacterium]